MNIDKPLVSIITPAYNAELYIRETIKSVLNQSYQNWELIIVNDGSTDNTKIIVEEFNDSRIIFLSQKNGGVSSARNEGLNRSGGEYITFLDADDLLPFQSLEKRVTYMNMNLEVDVLDGKIILKDEKMIKRIKSYEPYYQGELLEKLLKLDNKVFFNVCYFFRKEILEETLFHDKMTHAEDLLFYLELSSRKKINYSSILDEVYWYRTGHTSAMTNLEGLESGYIQLIQNVKKLQNIPKIDFLIFKMKIAKIMFLSWLNQKNIKNGIKSVFYMLEVMRKERI